MAYQFLGGTGDGDERMIGRVHRVWITHPHRRTIAARLRASSSAIAHYNPFEFSPVSGWDQCGFYYVNGGHAAGYELPDGSRVGFGGLADDTWHVVAGVSRGASAHEAWTDGAIINTSSATQVAVLNAAYVWFNTAGYGGGPNGSEGDVDYDWAAAWERDLTPDELVRLARGADPQSVAPDAISFLWRAECGNFYDSIHGASVRDLHFNGTPAFIPGSLAAWQEDYDGPLTAGSAQALEYTGVGGAVAGGSATVSMVLNKTGTGGAASSGAATVTKSLNQTAAGAATSGGSATVAKALVASGAGAGTSGGSASVNVALTRSGTGPATTGGAISVTISVNFTPSGAATSGGSATVTKALIAAPAGTATSSGSATVTKALVFTGSGTATVGGAADFESTGSQNYTGTGGAVSGGSASVTNALSATGAGGAVSGGTVTFSKGLSFTGAGSGTAGGSGQWTKVLTKAGSGGGTGSGSAPVTIALNVTGTSGPVLGGTSPHNIAITFTGTGGGVAGGEASTTGSNNAFYTGVGGAVAGGSVRFTRWSGPTLRGSLDDVAEIRGVLSDGNIRGSL